MQDDEAQTCWACSGRVRRGSVCELDRRERARTSVDLDPVSTGPQLEVAHCQNVYAYSARPPPDLTA